MAAPPYASMRKQPDYRGASPATKPAPSGPKRASPAPSPRRSPGDRPRDPRVIPPRPAPQRNPAPPEKPVMPAPKRPPPDYNPRPNLPEAPRPVADPFIPDRPGRPYSPPGVSLPALAGKALDAWNFLSIFIDPDEIFRTPPGVPFISVTVPPGTINAAPSGNQVVYCCGTGPMGHAWGAAGISCGSLPCGTALQVPKDTDYDGGSVATGAVVYTTYQNVSWEKGYSPNMDMLLRGPFTLGRSRYTINHQWHFPSWVVSTTKPGYDPNFIPKVTISGGIPAALSPFQAPALPIAVPPGQFVALPATAPVARPGARPATWPWFDRVESNGASYGVSSPDVVVPQPYMPPYQVPDLGSVVISPGGNLTPVAAGGHNNLPPRGGEKERKFKTGSAGMRVVMGVLNGLTEAGDFIDAIYKSIPSKGTGRRWKGRDGKWRETAITPQDKLAFIAENWDKIDMDEALSNLAQNEFEDRLLGGAHKKANDAYTRNPYFDAKRGRGLASGPAL